MHLPVLRYNDLDTKGLEAKISKVEHFLREGNFTAADVRKMGGTDYYRARLDDTNRLLFTLARYQGAMVALLLEVIRHHKYEGSRFLRGYPIDESKILPLTSCTDEQPQQALRYFHENCRQFCLLDKILVFDEDQSQLYAAGCPLIIIGSAGSGKTAITLEKMKKMSGEVLYITQSPYLVVHSRNQYFWGGYDNPLQESYFLSFQEFLATYKVPESRELSYGEFSQWFIHHRNQYRFADAGQVLEEFKGVITGSVIEKSALTRDEYQNLGIKQSIFVGEQRGQIYHLFEKYLQLLKETGTHDINLLTYEWLPLIEPTYDAVVIDEVQDLTTIQLYAIMRSLKQSSEFILCGDANQIVHPNFFSWSKIKSLFYHENLTGGRELIRVLSTNYRSSAEVTELANRLLKIKQARFGSIDRESNYLIKPLIDLTGDVDLLKDKDAVKRAINEKTRESTHYAVLVMHDEDKERAKCFFSTPLIFSIREAKGLEYENVILYNLITGNRLQFQEITDGITHEHLRVDELGYVRGRDKGDKSLEILKFYINALYVAMTRSVKNLFIIEQDHSQRLLDLLGLTASREEVKIQEEVSSREEWQREAHRLDLQGKREQAEAIRRTILKTAPVPWDVLTPENLGQFMERAYAPKLYAKKEQRMVYAYGVIYRDDTVFDPLIDARFSFAKEHRGDKAEEFVRKRFMPEFDGKDFKALQTNLNRYGIDYRNPLNMTPLMTSGRLGEADLVLRLLDDGADNQLTDLFGQNTFDHMLREACRSSSYASEVLPRIYETLAPAAINVKVNDRLIKLDRRLMEYHLVTAMMVMVPWVLLEKSQYEFPAFQAKDFVAMFSHFPQAVMAQRRKQRPYISSVLAKNEVNKIDKYNRQLFARSPFKTGCYLFNPQLEIERGGKWVNIYDATGLPLIREVTPNGWTRDHIDRLFRSRDEAKNSLAKPPSP